MKSRLQSPGTGFHLICALFQSVVRGQPSTVYCSSLFTAVVSPCQPLTPSVFLSSRQAVNPSGTVNCLCVSKSLFYVKVPSAVIGTTFYVLLSRLHKPLLLLFVYSFFHISSILFYFAQNKRWWLLKPSSLDKSKPSR